MSDSVEVYQVIIDGETEYFQYSMEVYAKLYDLKCEDQILITKKRLKKEYANNLLKEKHGTN